MSKIFSIIVATLLVTIATSSTNTVHLLSTDELKVETKSMVAEKSSNPVYYGWDMTTNPQNPVYRRIDGPLEIDDKCDIGTNDCVLEAEEDHGETLTEEQADKLGLVPADGSSPDGQYLFD